MQFSTTRSVEPFKITGSLSMEAVDIEAAFAVGDPDEDLFFRIFGPGWDEEPVSEQLLLLSKVAKLAETALNLNLRAGPNVLKGGI